MIPIAAPGLTLPRCGQLSTIRYGFFMALMPGNGTGVLPRPWPFCAMRTPHMTNAVAMAATILDLIRLKDSISVAPYVYFSSAGLTHSTVTPGRTPARCVLHDSQASPVTFAADSLAGRG